jgi:hypothetical protein
MLYKHNAGVLPTYIRYQSGVEKVTSFNFFFFDWVPGFEGQDTGVDGHQTHPLRLFKILCQVKKLRSFHQIYAVNDEIKRWQVLDN